MAEKVCAICGKHSWMGGKRKLLRGKYNPTMKVRRRPNLQWVRLPFSKKGVSVGARIVACAKCIKSLAKT